MAPSQQHEWNKEEQARYLAEQLQQAKPEQPPQELPPPPPSSTPPASPTTPHERDMAQRRTAYEQERARRRSAYEQEMARRRAAYEFSKAPQYRSFKTPEEEEQARQLLQQFRQAPMQSGAMAGQANMMVAAVGGPEQAIMMLMTLMQDLAQRIQAMQATLQEIKTLVQDRAVVGP